jgi:hypothetical protein
VRRRAGRGRGWPAPLVRGLLHLHTEGVAVEDAVVVVPGGEP